MNKKNNGMMKNALYYVLVILAMVMVVYFIFGNNGQRSSDIEYSKFTEQLQAGKIKEFEVQPANGVYKITGEYKEQQTVANSGGLAILGSTDTTTTHFTTIILPNDTTLSQVTELAKENKVATTVKEESSSGIWVSLLLSFLPIVIIIFFFYMMMGQQGGGGGGGGRVMNFGKSISGSEFVDMFVGVGASRVRDLFETAKKNAPAIIFIDEIDAVGRQRGAGMGGGHDEREQTLNQLLVEMDGFDGNEGVIVIAATNRSDVLDPALLRPGRFDRQILVGRPDVKGREAILRVHARNKPMADDVDLKVVAQQTPGFAGADLENVLNEAALVAARRNKKKIDASDIDEAEDRVIAGPAKKDRVISKKEREMVAYHEAGHTIVGLVLSRARVVHKVTIIPRGRAGGYMIALPKEDQFLMTKEDMFEQIVGLLGGRTAEEIIFNVQSTGASNDFEQATALARSMVTEYGMSDRLGPVQYEGNHQVFVGRDYGQTKAYSEQVAFEIDQEVRKILMEAHDKAREIIEAHRAQHKLIAEKLLEFETLDAKAIKSLFEHGVMPEGTESNDYPSEKEAKTFEEAKRALEEKDAEKQAEEKRDFEEAKHELNEENKAEHDSDSQQSEDNHSDDQYK